MRKYGSDTLRQQTVSCRQLMGMEHIQDGASLYALWKHPRKYTLMYALVVLLNPFKLTIDTGITTGNGDDKSQEASTAV